MSLHSGMEMATNAASMRLRRESPSGSDDVLPSSLALDPSEGASSLSPDAREEARATRRDDAGRGASAEAGDDERCGSHRARCQ